MIFGGLYGSNWQSSSSVYSSALAQSSALYAQQIAQCQAALGAHPLDQSQLAALLAFSDEIAPSKPIEDTGIELGEVIAWRAWKIQHGWLYSMVANEEWEPGEIKKAHKISEVLGDGIHAFKRRIDAANYCTQPGSIVGQVALWGTIYEFEKGWHGEYASVHSLDFIPRPYRSGWLRRRRDKIVLAELCSLYLEAPNP